jgi:hypothetical protein
MCRSHPASGARPSSLQTTVPSRAEEAQLLPLPLWLSRCGTYPRPRVISWRFVCVSARASNQMRARYMAAAAGQTCVVNSVGAELLQSAMQISSSVFIWLHLPEFAQRSSCGGPRSLFICARSRCHLHAAACSTSACLRQLLTRCGLCSCLLSFSSFVVALIRARAPHLRSHSILRSSAALDTHMAIRKHAKVISCGSLA